MNAVGRRAYRAVQNPGHSVRVATSVARARSRASFEIALFRATTSLWPLDSPDGGHSPRVIHCLGDSHTRAYSFARRKLRWPLLTTTVLRGATARGLNNPKSSTGAGQELALRLRAIPLGHMVVLHTGEVDVGIALWRIAESRKVALDKLVTESQGRYFEFIAANRAGTLVVAGVTPPTVVDYSVSPSAEREGLGVSYEDRWDLTEEWNRQLSARCAERDLVYMDCFSPFVEPQRHQVRPQFRPVDQSDHHLHPVRFGTYLGEQALPDAVARFKRITAAER